MDFSNFESAFNEVVDAIANLKEEAQTIKDRMEEIVDACETLECDL